MGRDFVSRLCVGVVGACAATALGVSTAQFVSVKEGRRLVAYQDVAKVWTACDGVTRGIGPNMVFTNAECDAMLMSELLAHERGMRSCLTAPDAIPDKTYLAFVSFTYNVGIGAFCASTLRALANAGDLAAACNQLPRWVRAGGRVWNGLVLRRADERALCLLGLEPAAAPELVS